MLGFAMRIEVVRDAAAVAESAAGALCDAVRARPDIILALPTGDTPVRLYAELERRETTRRVSFSGVTAFAIDEFAGVARDARGTNRAFYRDHLRIRLGALHCPDASAPAPDAEITAFAAMIRNAGGIDLCLLGIGTNGHIAFNEPGAGRESAARAVDLAPSSRDAHAAAFGSLDAVPARGMTLGVADLLASRRIIVLAQGEGKAEIVRAAIEDPPTPDLPASWLQTHAEVTWILDEAAAAGLG
jgi:glucosamine-6-phosphate deaminase